MASAAIVPTKYRPMPAEHQRHARPAADEGQLLQLPAALPQQEQADDGISEP